MAKLLIVISVLLICIPELHSGEIIAQSDKNCFRCHSMGTLGVRDSVTGFIRSLSVDPDEFYSSNHKNLGCLSCHDKSLASFPHPPSGRSEELQCFNCHQDSLKLGKYNFGSITASFKKSIHYTATNGKFTCFECHDPHTFKINARVNPSIRSTVNYDNLICMECHTDNSRIFNLSGKTKPPISATHNWLPHLDLHLSSVRCIDCHTSASAGEPGVSHMILSKDKAVKDCVKCHSTNSLLVHSLYKFNSVKERDEKGFINAVVLNNSYVIGATRNEFLNIISFIIFGITIIALSIHIFFRWKGYRKNGR